jgi:hypothetical protein
MGNHAQTLPWRTTDLLLPKRLIEWYQLFRHCACYPALRRTLANNLAWRDAFKGERVYVIANGPSLAAFDRRELHGRRVVVMNSFERAEWKSEVVIVAHCLGEPRLSPAWSDPCPTINGTNSASYWMHFSSKDQFSGLAQDKKIHYVLPGYGPHIWGRREVRLHRVTLGYQTTAQLAIMVALYMGFKDIVLLGFDHDWLASPNFSKHFYSSEPDPDDKLHTFSYYKIITSVLRMWEFYYALRSAADAHGATIRNWTPNSFLDVFPRGPSAI